MSVEQDVVSAIADAWDAEPDGIWEPARLPRFKIGDRVQIQGGECQVIWDGSGPETPPGHPDEFLGLSATVIVICHEADWRRSWARTHPYGVQFDDLIPVSTTDWMWGAAYFAACELIPLDGAN